MPLSVCLQTFVSQSALEKHMGVSEGKFVKGLGQTEMAFVEDNEVLATADAAL